jgi:hypothetical protein
MWKEAAVSQIERVTVTGAPPLLSSGQSSWLQLKRARVQLLMLPDFLSTWSGKGSTHPREDKSGAA